MKRIARFEKVSRSRFEEDWLDTFGERAPEGLYDRLMLPVRATGGSAGYDFKCTRDVCLEPGETVSIPTGIRVWIEEGWVLQLFPRSGLGVRYRMQLNNSVGIIDSDYYVSRNEGHIFIKITNDSKEGKALALREGDGFVQGVFVEYGITLDDEASARRDGGFGSTSK